MAYVTLQEVRDFGLSEEVASDAQVEAAIELWSVAIDKICGQWFEPREATFRLDGNNKDTLYLPVPVIEVSEMRINGSSVALAASSYTVYSSRTIPDDRISPKIGLGGQDTSLPTTSVFASGRRNQYIAGTFGYVEEDLSTPALIKYALLKLISQKLKSPENPGEDMPPDEDLGLQGPVIEETTDGHSRKWAAAQLKNVRPGIASGITDDPEINKILLMYKGPAIVRVTGRR